MDVDGLERGRVTRRLDQPGEVHDGVGALEEVGERRARDVRGEGLRLRRVPVRRAPGEPDDLGDVRVGGERRHDARPDVAGGSGDDDAHPLAFPSPSAGRKP